MVQSKYTKDEPFEFDHNGMKVEIRRFHDGIRYAVADNLAVPVAVADAYAAAREAERGSRETWEWTNDDHTEARKGRWFVEPGFSTGVWFLGHDDWGRTINVWTTKQETQLTTADRVPRQILADFLAWSAEQRAQEQPSGFGYVGTITDDGGQVYDVFHTDDEEDPFTWTERNSGVTGISSWGNIPWRNTFKGVEDA